MVPINYFAVLLSAALALCVGYFWYYKFFALQYEALSEQTPEKKARIQAYIAENSKMYVGIQVLGVLLTAFALAYFTVFTASYLQIPGLPAGILSGFFCWLGFVAPVLLSQSLSEGKEWRLWLLNAGYYLCALLVMGFVLGFWS